jgi:hypothetical protein
MPSPFPGMNPYLEHPAFWHDFHGVFVTRMRIELAGELRDRYQVRMDENIYVHELGAEERRLLGRPDVQLTETQPGSGAVASKTALVAPAEGILPDSVDILRERFIEIRDRRYQSLVTVIELLSPANKCPGPDREQYLSKRRQYLASAVNLIEIDLLRVGARMPVTGLPACDYCVVVSPGPWRPKAGLWPIQLADFLPEIPVPLAGDDEPAHLNLQALFQRAFDDGGYGAELYKEPLDPPLSPAQSAWMIKNVAL